MMIWRFDEFVLSGGRGIISDVLAVAPRAELDVILTEHLGIRANHEWGKPHYFPLGKGLGEIRFCVDKVQYRVYGSFATGMVFRMWMTATKHRKRKGNQATDPPDAIEKARQRKKNHETHGMGRLQKYVGPEVD